MNLEDLEGSIEVIIFPKVYDENKETIQKDAIVVVQGNLDVSEGKVKLIANKISTIEGYKKSQKKLFKSKNIMNDEIKKSLHIEIDCNKNQSIILLELKKRLVAYPGQSQVILHFQRNGKSITHLIDKKFSVDLKSEIVDDIRNIIEKDKVWIEKRDN